MAKDVKEKDYLKVQSKIKYFIFLCLYYLLFPFGKLLYGQKNKWLICELGDDAQDNGYYFLKYLSDKHPEITTYYLIKKDSPDYIKVCSITKVVEFGSFKHFLMAISCRVKISSHLFGYAPWIQMMTFYRRNKTKGVHVFLQHGITKNYQKGFLAENCKSLSLFVCGAKPEYSYIESEFGYKNDVVQYTGFPRYDSLNNVNLERKQILVFPTWRRFLDGLTDGEFKTTQFFCNWNSIVNNPEIINICKANRINIKFCLHPSVQKYKKCFDSNDITSIVDVNEQDIQTLLNESALLVTDFSSVFFDFAYLKKPVIYFQFDELDYYQMHYDKGYFDYRRDGFGPVFVNVEETISYIKEAIANNFQLDRKYSNRIASNFIYNDKNNCSRVFERINYLLNKH